MNYNSDLEYKSDRDIVETLIIDTISDKIIWENHQSFIFTKIKIDNGVFLIFKITDTLEEEEDDEYTSRYTNYFDDSMSRIINLNVFMKKKSNPKEIFLKKINVSQIELIDLLEVVTPNIKHEKPNNKN
jgi:hypothetical protein